MKEDKKNRPKVSMIIVSYNEKEYLSRAIQSCLCQKYDNKEIIIGDDGSNDGSIDIISSYSNVNYFVMKRTQEKTDIIPSLRVSNVIKNALDIATGEYVILLSGDDYFCDDDILEKAVAYLENNRKYSAYVYGFKYVNDKKEEKIAISRRYIPWLYWSGDYIHISCFIFRKIGSQELLNLFCDDVGLEYVLATRGRWKYDEKVVFAYFQRENSIMHKADDIELALLETLLYQDIKYWKGKASIFLKLASVSRFYSRVIFLRRNRLRIDAKYNKYKKKFWQLKGMKLINQKNVITWIEVCLLSFLQLVFKGLRFISYNRKYVTKKSAK